MITAAINDVLLVWFLAPTKPLRGESDGAAANKQKRERPSHMFQPGDFTFSERAMCVVRKMVMYAAIGAVTASLAMACSLVLSSIGSAAGAGVTWSSALQRAAVIGALHLGISANIRYQTVNGVEVVLYRLLSQNLARTSSVCLRMINNFAGARLWIVISSACGV